MTTTITDADLHAYVDGCLDPGRRDVEAFLSTRPDKAATVEDYRRQNLMLHRLFDRIEQRRAPGKLLELAANADRALRAGRRLFGVARATAVCASLALVAVTAWYVLFDRGGPDPLRDFRQQAIRAHLALGDDAATGDPAADGAVLSAPELDAIGLIPVARRTFPSASGAALQIIYMDAENRRISLYLKNVTTDVRDALTFTSQDGVGQMYWRNAGFAFGLLGPSDKAELSRIADAIGGIDTATFLTLDELPVDAAATAVQIELEPVSDAAPEVEAAPPVAPPTADENAPDKSQSRRAHPVGTLAG